jgi:hypothetical protein
MEAMAPVCRTSGCASSPADELGYCGGCRSRYEDRRSHVAQLGERCRRRHWRLFAALTDEQARALTEHAAGNAQIGRSQIGWAIGELLVEAHEAALHAVDAARWIPARPRRWPIPGGRS